MVNSRTSQSRKNIKFYKEIIVEYLQDELDIFVFIISTHMVYRLAQLALCDALILQILISICLFFQH